MPDWLFHDLWFKDGVSINRILTINFWRVTKSIGIKPKCFRVYGISLASNIKGINSFLLIGFLFDSLWCLGGVFSHDHYRVMLFNFFLFAYAYILRNLYNIPYQKVITASYPKIWRAKSGGLLQEIINFTHNRTDGNMNLL